MATISDEQIPRSVRNLWHAAQVSHQGIAPASDVFEALRTAGGVGKARHSLALGIQESTSWELIDLMIDKVLCGRALHHLLKGLNDQGFIRRDDLVEWSEVFT